MTLLWPSHSLHDLVLLLMPVPFQLVLIGCTLKMRVAMFSVQLFIFNLIPPVDGDTVAPLSVSVNMVDCVRTRPRLESRSVVVHGTQPLWGSTTGEGCTPGASWGVCVCVCVCVSCVCGEGEELKAPSNTWGSCDGVESLAERRACSHRVYLTRSHKPTQLSHIEPGVEPSPDILLSPDLRVTTARRVTLSGNTLSLSFSHTRTG